MSIKKEGAKSSNRAAANKLPIKIKFGLNRFASPSIDWAFLKITSVLCSITSRFCAIAFELFSIVAEFAAIVADV